jgi:hypothetical protein
MVVVRTRGGVSGGVAIRLAGVAVAEVVAAAMTAAGAMIVAVLVGQG